MKGTRTCQDNEPKPKTKMLMAKNVKPGNLVFVAGGLGLIDVAENKKTAKGNRRISEAAVLRPGNRRKRRYESRGVIVTPATKMEVVA